MASGQPQESTSHSSISSGSLDHDDPQPSSPPFISPFKDSADRLCESSAPRYSQPNQVNSYVKFRWYSRRRSSSAASLTQSPATLSQQQLQPSTPSTIASRLSTPEFASTSSSRSITVATPLSPSRAAAASENQSEASFAVVADPTNAPTMLPPHFGLMTAMDARDRPLWDFYVKNWCPGRSVLERTNLWIKDFANMHQNSGIQAAIHCLAGIYIYDYLPTPQLRRQVNEKLALADRQLTHLLSKHTALDVNKIGEVITILILLSMQDIIMVERRAKKPLQPRWLQGFIQAEQFLKLSSQGIQGQGDEVIEITSLHISQAVMVGRGLILTETLMELRSPEELNPSIEVKRYDWLLLGSSMKECLEIHGGCGFSRKLLHIISQITYCAARLQQDPDSVVVPITAKFLSKDLEDMKQWSTESMTWETAQLMPPVIDRVRTLPTDYIVNSAAVMTNVTAEAWRIASIIYLQCRLLRLPRNHPRVASKMSDLADCIRILPTSGAQFTAQAPLFPIFLLGMLATTTRHKTVATDWFESVVGTPVRSSVSILYESLTRIWEWVDTELPLRSLDEWENSIPISRRAPWWEELVGEIEATEDEILCLT